MNSLCRKQVGMWFLLEHRVKSSDIDILHAIDLLSRSWIHSQSPFYNATEGSMWEKSPTQHKPGLILSDDTRPHMFTVDTKPYTWLNRHARV